MSSRPATPSDDKDPPETRPKTPRVTLSRKNTLVAPETRESMLATAHFPSHSATSQLTRQSIFEHRHTLVTDTSLLDSIFSTPNSSSHHSSQSIHAVQPQPYTQSLDRAALDFFNDQTLDADNGRPKTRRSSIRQVDTRPTRPSTAGGTEESSTVENESTAEPTTAPPKKKRTRTLTTAHQSSVLLALLAKTPFPTTAEREEVGRRIGLTARKVQVWFQNQRQKQKKAASSGDIAMPPQGATTSAPLPLSRQPGFSALHAARMGAASQNPDTGLYNPSGLRTLPAGNSSVPPGHYTSSPSPILPTPSRGHPPESYPSATAYGRSFTDPVSYYQSPTSRAPEVDPYPAPPSTASSSGRPYTSHSHPHVSPVLYSTSTYGEPFGPPPSIDSGHSHSQTSPSHAHSTSVEHTERPAAESNLAYGMLSGDAWRYKPLPPLPPVSAGTTRDRSVSWGHAPPEFESQPPPEFSTRSRALSNPDRGGYGYETGRLYAHVRGASGTSQPPSSYGPSRYQTQSTAPGVFQQALDFNYEDVTQSGTPSSSLAGDSQYSVRYGEPHSSPEGASSSSAFSYPDAITIGIAPASHLPSARVTYSPIDRRTNRLSNDSSQLGGSLLGKRSWGNEPEVPNKRARTDDGHVSLSLRTGSQHLSSSSSSSSHTHFQYPQLSAGTPTNRTTDPTINPELSASIPHATGPARHRPEDPRSHYYPHAQAPHDPAS